MHLKTELQNTVSKNYKWKTQKKKKKSPAVFQLVNESTKSGTDMLWKPQNTIEQ